MRCVCVGGLISGFGVVVLRCLVSLSALILVICICLLVGAIVFPGFADYLWVGVI